MKKVGNHNSISRKLFFSLALSLAFSLTSFAQDAAPAAATEVPVATQGGDPIKGKELFNSNCAACHKLDGKATGPALRGIADRRDKQWLYKWIHNSADLIKSGDADAIKVFEENNKVAMTAFPQLSEGDIDNIIAYTSEVKAEAPAPLPGAAAGTTSQEGGLSNNLILGALALVMLMLVVMLFLVSNVLAKVAKANGIEVAPNAPRQSIWKAFVRNQFLVLVASVFLLLASGYFVYGYLMQVGVDQDYAPIQPIHFSHKIHAGDNEINCKYCHSAARVSKNAGIPSLNVCMNCHKNIAEVAEATATPEYSKAFYDEQIQKLYTAVGWDKAAQTYTGKTEPVKWVRIHNLPDFVYFNHSQHVTVAGLECQTCHGPVETYEVQKQFAPLTMGWCIDCHRKTDVKMEGNEYYAKIHAELSKKYGVEKLTAAQMGGLECGKCHY
ncbi:c-type cytochrome [Flavobacterium granuli]|uniref:Quinol:cytochrome c oxidoreductase pentaheme cytochrome subunit n=1 Tax=Flavobacterium granuli TaxID=280093 RepID=A0A1M5MP97_9FLAO|nr:c-type cytochrome [Flavobacterium granuli]PRZ25011.1 quinol:cytochrome c oxidoreductase pentaheme cytochrome subunit [Flavobacterium granuli]SHG78729.1 quinol:cytochrome c oxidoreductase pentaheme cytochrome subunit [Flavobacterium granuli]